MAKLTRRGWIVLVVIPILVLAFVVGYATADTCYVGSDGNFLGYGSCSDHIDKVIGGK